MKKLLGLVLLCAILAAPGCVGTKYYIQDGQVTNKFLQVSTNTMMTTRATWYNTQDAFAKAKIAGMMTDAQWNSWSSVDAKFRASQNALTEVLKVYAGMLQQLATADQAGDAASVSQIESKMSAKEALINSALANITGILVEGQNLLTAVQQ